MSDYQPDRGIGVTVLVIDDQGPVRRSVCRSLQMENYTTVEAADGQAGLQALADNSCDLVISDIIMPDSEGFETIMAIRQKHPNIPIIAMSGASHGDTYLSVATKMGASATLAKPFNANKLLSTVHEVLRSLSVRS